MSQCMCGDPCCPSCGPAQGNSQCPVCGAWADDGCEDPQRCKNMRLKDEADELSRIEEQRYIDEWRKSDDQRILRVLCPYCNATVLLSSLQDGRCALCRKENT